MAVDMAICSLSYSEHDALQKILAQMEEDEDVIVASKIAAKYKLTNSVIVSALKKMESAGILETKSLGMKGTYILSLIHILINTAHTFPVRSANASICAWRSGASAMIL